MAKRRAHVCVSGSVIEFTDLYTHNANQRSASVLIQCIPRGNVWRDFLGLL